ncbi:hypothetical protein KFK09_001763 [Dendrobium nobile]|uniref:Reverse transcriptase zinc-binding domain-containing protein n=1 Tax=Dendrobium nobile TaxID=94219 RepID=A0A8T3C5Q0_DENNO|nr:hypothetical protein KFK09_001763 [Dendrobium nobile]
MLHHKEVGNWIENDIWVIPSYIPANITQDILNISILNQAASAISWNKVKLPVFKNFYSFFFFNSNKVDWFKYVWHKNYALRFSSFTWMVMLNGLKTADILIKRNIMVPSNCILCNNGYERHRHLFFECEFSFQIISKFVPNINFFMLRLNLMQILEFIWNSKWNKDDKNLYFLCICCSLYFIWKESNCRKMENKFSSQDSIYNHIRFKVQAKVFSWSSYPKIQHRII